MTGEPNPTRLGNSVLSEPRWLPGSATESAVVFAIGGAGEQGSPLATTDTTHF